MTFKWPIQTLSVSIADDLQRCLGWVACRSGTGR
jgi:hypothetical protein